MPLCFNVGDLLYPGIRDSIVSQCTLLPLPDELDAGGREAVDLEVVGDGQDVLDRGGAQRHGVEVHVVDDLRHDARLRDVLQLHARRVLLPEFTEHRPAEKTTFCRFC